MITRKNSVVASLLGRSLGARSRRAIFGPRPIAAAAGRPRGASWHEGLHQAEHLEQRTMLDGDHPAFPVPFNPAIGTVLTLDAASPLTAARRGRALTGANEGVAGTIAAGDTGDTFRFTMPSVPGRTSDFVTILADTLLAPNGTALNSLLDTQVEVYNSSGTRIATGSSNGVLSSSNVAVSDGWIGFVATPGQSYTILVRAQQGTVSPGRTLTGNYTLRVDTTSIDYAYDNVVNPMPMPGQETFGEGDVAGSIAFRGDEIVYRVTTGATDEYKSLATASAIADDAALLDTHLEVYDSGNASGLVTQLASDVQAGRLTNAFTNWRSAPSSTFYVRVRSDERNAGRPATGNYSLAIDVAALNIAIDPVTRLAEPMSGPPPLDFQDAVAPLITSNAPDGTAARLYSFTAEGTGTSFITIVGLGQVPLNGIRKPGGLGNYPPLEDPAVHLYNDQGTEIAFNDDANGFTPQLEVALTGGTKYYILVEGFDRALNGDFGVFIEAHYTLDSTDDHVDDQPANIINFDLATPLRFGDPFLLTDGDGNPVLDRSWLQTANQRGRIYNTGDTDLFQFTPPVNTLDSYAGDDGNQNTALYVGGNFGTADRLNPNNIATAGRGAPNVAIWSADDWWNAGPNQEGMGLDPAALFGAPSSINGDIRAMTTWDPDGAGTTFGTCLVAGGSFTDTAGNQVNIALRIFAPLLGRFVWAPVTAFNGALFSGSVNDVVQAFTVFDLDTTGATPDLPPRLIVGGKFTNYGGQAVNNIFALRGTAAGALVLQTLGTGLGGAGSEVRALATWDAPQPAQPPDPPLRLAIGGIFAKTAQFYDNNTNIVTATTNNVVLFGPQDNMQNSPLGYWGLGTNTANGTPAGAAGAVNALTVYDEVGQEQTAPGNAMSQLEDIPARLVLGGAFTSAGGVAANHIAIFTGVVPQPTGTPPRTQTAFRALGAGFAGEVRALTIWHLPSAPEMTGDDMSQAIVAAGDGATPLTSGAVRLWQSFSGMGAWANLTTANDGTVRSLAVFEQDEMDVTAAETLYIGGDFTTLDGQMGFNHVASLDDQNADGGFAWKPLKGGVAGLAPGELAPTSVFALGAFNDNVGGIWDRNERPAGRVSITVAPTTDAFLNTFVTVYDSNFNVIYTNETIAPPFPDPSGSLDPASAAGPGTPDAFVLPGLWAGETYYIAVSGSQGAGTGRYTISVTQDALPPENPDNLDGVYQDVISTIGEVPNENQWAIAPEIDLNQSGDGSNWDLLTANGRVAFQQRVYKRTPNTRMDGGIRRAEEHRVAMIETINDTDLYQFRASATGTVEIRVSTTALQTRYDEDIRTQTPAAEGVFNTSGGGFQTVMVEQPVQVERTFNSPLDAMLQVFNNDFEQLGINDDGRAVTGFNITYPFAQTGRNNTYRQRDPRLVIPVVAGETYFIQVGSAYRATFNTDPGMVDWRHAMGAYELTLNNTESTHGIDDYEDNDGPALINFTDQTAIPIDQSTGNGSISGIIDNVPTGAFTNILDTDAFRFIAVNRGNARVTVQATSLNLNPSVRIFDTQGVLRASSVGTAGGQVTLNISAVQGNIFFVVVDGAGGTEGTYDLSVDSVGLNDDYTKDGDWLNATPVQLNAFLGTYSVNGVIENPADEDLFTFHADKFEIATVTVHATDATLDPVVLVYEINADGQDAATRNPSFLLIGANNDADASTTDARVNFSVTQGRDYFIVVRGLDLGTHFGRYNVTINVIPTDDHPNRVDFPLATQLDLSTNFDPLTLTSSASLNGKIEVNTDDDMFRFTGPATGRATVTVTTPTSLLSAKLFIYDANNTLIGSADPTAGTATFTFNISQNVQYYLQVAPGTLSAPDMTDDTGDYTINVNTEPVDDFPNEGDFANPNVGVITLNSSTGVGTRSGVIVPSTDTDLFKFTTLAAGNVTIRMSTVGSSLNPKIRLFNSSFAEIPGGTSNGDTATLTFTASGAGQVFYVLASPNDGATGATAVGNYAVQVTATIPGGGGGGGMDDHADAGEFGDATLIQLSSRNGFGSATGIIETAGDTDLFKFVPAANGTASIQVKTPAGGLVDGRIKVFNQSQVQIGEDIAGIPGATAAFTFSATAGQIYYVLVEPIGIATGSYTVEVQAQPITHFLYYPEGFAGSTIDEFVPIVNPNSFPIDYSIYARYETGANPNTPIATGTIAPNSRGGVTISSKTGASLVDRGRPYALEIQSTGQLGATLSHYDFNVSVGEAFSNQLSTTWTFAQVNKDHNTFRDFVLFYNPSNSDTSLTIDLFYQDGTVTTITQTLGALRRGGINFDNDNRITKVGRFGMRITSTSGIVAALSSYNIVNSGGDGLLGDADGGNTTGVIPNISSGGGVTSSLSFLNTTNAPATITVVASYARVDLPDLVRVISLPAGRQTTVSLASLGLINGQQAGIRYTSNVAVTGSVIEYQNGDGDSTAAATYAAQKFVFGDLFVNPAFAGVTYIEKLGLYNPSATAIDITLNFLFTDGTSATSTVNVASGRFAFVEIDQQAAILSKGSPTAFSLVVSSATPMVASLSHYDLFLNGGWSTLGAPIGLTNSLSSILPA